MMRRLLFAWAFLLAVPAAAQDMSAFTVGPVFENFGPVADIPDADFQIPEGMEFKVAFDVATPADGGKLNRTFESAARLVNMHQRAGVEPVNNRAVVVVHGRAVFDLLTDEAWAAAGRAGANPSGAPVREMIDQGIRFVVCGQSAAAYGVKKDELIPGVELALSAMTAHAVLQQQGYTVNPF
jgi:intracellular sulfur oxidation DsrE/DsrF family protein